MLKILRFFSVWETEYNIIPARVACINRALFPKKTEADSVPCCPLLCVSPHREEVSVFVDRNTLNQVHNS